MAALNYKNRYEKLAAAVRVLQNTQNLVISSFAEDGLRSVQSFIMHTHRYCSAHLVTSRCRCRRGLFGKRLGTILHPDSPSTRYRIRCGFIFSFQENVLKVSELATEYVGCVCTEAVSGNKKLRIQKYPDTWERGIRHPVGPAYCEERAYCNSVFCEERDPRLICFGFPLGIELCLAK